MNKITVKIYDQSMRKIYKIIKTKNLCVEKVQLQNKVYLNKLINGFQGFQKLSGSEYVKDNQLIIFNMFGMS